MNPPYSISNAVLMKIKSSKDKRWKALTSNHAKPKSKSTFGNSVSPCRSARKMKRRIRESVYWQKTVLDGLFQMVYIIRMTVKQIEGYTVNLSQILGRGSFGHVYKGYHDESKEPVAVKILPRDISIHLAT